MRPTGRYVHIKPFTDNIMYANRLHLPDTAHTKATHGIIMRVGPRVRLVVPGEWAVYNRAYAHDIKDEEDTPCVVINERHLLCVLAYAHELRINVTLAWDNHHKALCEETLEVLRDADMVVKVILPDEERVIACRTICHSEALIVPALTTKTAFFMGVAFASHVPIWTSNSCFTEHSAAATDGRPLCAEPTATIGSNVAAAVPRLPSLATTISRAPIHFYPNPTQLPNALRGGLRRVE